MDEVVIAARVREEILQSVPISVSLVSGKTIDETSIDDLGELATSVPNFTVAQDPIGDKISSRGIFSGAIASLEQSVSTFVEGVNRGRGTQSRLALLDLERVEVLRGPEGTLFGKNAVGRPESDHPQTHRALRLRAQRQLRDRARRDCRCRVRQRTHCSDAA